MLRLAEVSIRFPKRVLVVWLVACAALGVAAFGVADQLSPSKTVIPGTESARADELATSQFGPSVLVPILLQGPAAQLNRQGPALVAALAKRSDTRVLSAWDPQQAESLRPTPQAAMIVASVARSEEYMVDTGQAQIERTVEETISGPVAASVTGQPSIDIALKDASLDAAVRGSRIALPILFLLLLIALRRPVAALAVTAFSAVAALAGIGLLALLARVIDTDPIAVAAGALTGLGVASVYAMTMTQRFVQRDASGPPSERGESAALADTIVRLSGRGVLVGGTAFLLALLVASRIAPSDALTSVGIGALACGLMSLVLAIAAMPAALVLLGRHLDALSFHPPHEPRASADQRLVVKHAGVAGVVAVLALGALAIPVLGLKTGPPSIAQLPADSTARESFETVGDVMGPGWATPFSVTVVNPDGPITSKTALTEIADFQTQVGEDPRVASVAGPGSFVASTADLKKLPKALDDSKKLLNGGKDDLVKLSDGLGEAGAGAVQLQSGLDEASTGAEQLASGNEDAEAGSAKLHAGLQKAEAGSKKISRGLSAALTGAEALRNGAGQALAGATLINGSLGTLADPVTSSVPKANALAGAVAGTAAATSSATRSSNAASSSLKDAIASLDAMGVGKDDPKYAATLSATQSASSSTTAALGALGKANGALALAVPGAKEMAAQVGQLSTALNGLHGGAGDLQAGIAKLQKGNTSLAGGIGLLNVGSKGLTAGLAQLTAGAGSLESGLGQLSTGSAQLATGLQSAVGPTGKLAAGLDTMETGVTQFSGALPSPKDLEELSKSSPGLFDSGYFVLAAVSGAPPAERNVASFAVNLDGGGTAGQIVVISKTDPSTAATQSLATDLQSMTRAFAVTSHLEAAVGGPAGNLIDYQSETTSKIAPAVASVAIAVALLLMLLLRSVLVPLVAVGSSLLACVATFGLLTLLFGGDDPPLGGPGYIDPMSIIAVFTAAFGLSAVFAGILLDEVRQGLAGGADVRAAVETALRRSARAGAIAGLVVALVAVPFAAQDLLNLRQFAVGLGLMAIVDVVLMRALLLPATIEILGAPAWWPTVAAAPPETQTTLPARPLLR